MTSQSPITVVGAIIVRDGLVFAARRNPRRSAGGLWEFPGGKTEPGESPEEALRRELGEELGIKATVEDLASRHASRVASGLIDLACYWARLDGPAPTSSTDHDELAWLSPVDLQGLPWSPADVPILEEVFPAGVFSSTGRNAS